MTAAQLLALAQAYASFTGLSLSEVGRRACGGNNRIFPRLQNESGCNSKSIERAANWFAHYWPEGLPVPKGVLLPPKGRGPSPAEYPLSRIPKRSRRG